MAETYGVKRKRCIVCDKLTHSGWKLGYPDQRDEKKWVEGTHCFKCSQVKRAEDPDAAVSVG